MTPRMAEATPSSAAQFLIHVPSGLLCARYKREYTKSVRLSSSLQDLLAGLGEAVCPSGCKQQKQTVRLQHKERYWRIWCGFQTSLRSQRLQQGRGLWGSRHWK